MRSIIENRKCKGCDNIFGVTTKDSDKIFCSLKCYFNSRSTPVKTVCQMCGKITFKQPSHLNKKTFCSVKCSSSSRIKPGRCIVCGKEIPQASRRYCSEFCHKVIISRFAIYRIENGTFEGQTKTIRNYLLSKRGHRCETCLNEYWQLQPIPLEVNHVDGNSENNKLENVKLICPNCHALTPNYKGRNKGKGRFSRMKRYYSGKSY